MCEYVCMGGWILNVKVDCEGEGAAEGKARLGKRYGTRNKSQYGLQHNSEGEGWTDRERQDRKKCDDCPV